MKSKFFVILLLAMAVGQSGCGKGKPADASRSLEKSFQSAEPPVQQAITSATKDLKAGNYFEAGRALTPAVTERPLTEGQQQAVGTAVRQLNQAVAADPKLNTKEMYEMRKRLFQAATGNKKDF